MYKRDPDLIRHCPRFSPHPIRERPVNAASPIGPQATCTSQSVYSETICDLVDHRIELLVFLPLALLKQQTL